MKYNQEEYKNLVIDLNVNKSNKTMWLSSIVFSIVILVISIINYKEFYFSFVLSIFVFVLMRYLMKKVLMDTAKKSNFVDDIDYVEQIIDEEKIIEETVKRNGTTNKGEYYYKDISFVKEDKKNYYLYLNSTIAIVVSKGKLENENDFRNKLSKNNLIK